MKQYTGNNVVSSPIHWHRAIFAALIGGSMGQSGHGPIMVLGRGLLPAPPQAVEGIVKGRWIVEISRFFARFACDYIKNIIQAYI